MISYKLNSPIEKTNNKNEKIIIESFQIDKLRAKHFAYIPKELYQNEVGGQISLPPNKLIPLIAVMTGQSKKIIDELDALDFMELAKIVGEQVGKQLSPITGEKS